MQSTKTRERPSPPAVDQQVATALTEAPDPARRLARRRRWERIWIPAVSLVVFALFYDLCISGVLAHERYLPGILDIIQRAGAELLTASLWQEAASTYGVGMLGFVVGTGIAIPLGLLSGRSQFAYRGFRMPVEFLRVTPAVAMIPLVAMVWGPTSLTKFFLVAITVACPIYLQTVYGVLDTNPIAIDTARSFKMSKPAILFRIILPSAAGYIATALRLFVLVATLVAVSVELVLGAGGGLGVRLAKFAEAADYVGMYSLMLILGIFGMLVTWLVMRLERRFLSWHESHRNEGKA